MTAPPPHPQPDTESLSDLVAKLWFRCMVTARTAGEVRAEAIQELIEKSRELMTKAGCTKRDADITLALVQNAIHWGAAYPTDRLFEVMLDFDLAEFWKERTGDDYGPSRLS